MNKKIFISIFALLTITNLFMSFSFNYSSYFKTVSRLSNNLLSNHAITCIIRGDNSVSFSELIQNIDENLATMLVADELESTNITIKGVYLTDKILTAGDTIINSFFIESEFIDDKNGVTVGINLFNNNNFVAKGKNSESLFLFNGKRQPVKGIINSEVTNMFDNTVFVHLEQTQGQVIKFYLDGVSRDDVERQLANLSKIYSIDIENGSSSFAQYNFASKNMVFLFIGILLQMLMVVTVVLLVWGTYRQEIILKYLFGFSRKRIFVSIIYEIGVINIIQLIVFTVIYLVAYLFYLHKLMIPNHFIMTLLYNTLVFTVIMLFTTLNVIINGRICRIVEVKHET